MAVTGTPEVTVTVFPQGVLTNQPDSALPTTGRTTPVGDINTAGEAGSEIAGAAAGADAGGAVINLTVVSGEVTLGAAVPAVQAPRRRTRRRGLRTPPSCLSEEPGAVGREHACPEMVAVVTRAAARTKDPWARMMAGTTAYLDLCRERTFRR